MPPRTISAIKAPVYTTSPKSRAANSGVRRSPPAKLKPDNSGTSARRGGSGWIPNPTVMIDKGTPTYARFHQGERGRLERLCADRRANQITKMERMASKRKIRQAGKVDVPSPQIMYTPRWDR